MLDKAPISEKVSERQMRLMLDVIPARIWILDRDHKVRFANREAAQLLMVQPGEVTGLTAQELLGEAGFEQDKAEREQALSGRSAKWEGWTPYPDGQNRYTQRNFSPHFNIDGQIDGYFEFVRDVTELKLAERKQAQTAQLLIDAIESLSHGFAIFDAQDRLVMCNAIYRSLNKGVSDLVVAGVTWRELTMRRAESGQFPDAVGRVEEWVENRARKRAQAGEDEFSLADGRWVQVSYRRTRQSGLVHIWSDVTERKRMEQDLRESEAQFRRVLEACPVAITMNRVEDGKLLYESPAARALLKYKDLKPGMSVLDRWVNPDERKPYIDRLRRNGAVDNLEIQYRKYDGEEFWISMSSRLIDYKGEEVIVSNIIDLTDRHAAEAEMSRQRDILHQNEKLSALGELLAGVAHELNNPLSVLVGQALMLRETAPDQLVATRAEKIDKAADRCAKIVKTFLAMARHEPHEMGPICLNGVIGNALEVTAYTLRTSGIRVSTRLAKELPAVTANADQMRQVFTNLIMNAHNALQDVEGERYLKISTRYSEKHDQVVIKVKNNGPGIPDEIKSRIFEPLFTTKAVGAGTGMGLAICHRIVDSHGGTIVLERTGGDGAAFAVRIPRTKEECAAEADSSQKDTDSFGHRVLVVDDEYDVGRIIADVLEHDGHNVEVVRSGAVALEKMKRQSYDVILSDIRMPGMDGPGLYRALSATKPELIDGLAFITGDTLTPKVREFLEASERPYLEKPILPRDIRSLVELLMRRKVN